MFRPTLRCSKSSNHASLPTAEEPAPPPLKGKTPAAEHRLQGFSCSVLRGGGEAGKREGAGIGTSGKVDANISGSGGARVHLGPAEEGKNGRAKARSGPDEAGPAEQKRAPGRQIRTAPRPSGLFHAADQPQGVSAAESPRRRRRTRRSGTPRGPAPSGRGSRRRWPRCRVRPAGRRFGRRFRPDCAAAAARRPAA